MGAFIFFSRAIKSIGICYSVQPLFCGRESMNSLGGANVFPRAPFCWGPPYPVFPKTLFPCVVFASTPGSTTREFAHAVSRRVYLPLLAAAVVVQNDRSSRHIFS